MLVGKCFTLLPKCDYMSKILALLLDVTKMREEFKPAIDALLADLADLEKQVLDTKLVINRLCSRDGTEPMFPDASAASGPTVGAIRPDSFYGKVLSTAAREYLEMRRSANLGPATPREVFEALVRGGYASEAKDEITAMIALRATLRKNSSIFHRLPNGTYGLLGWYPDAKPVRDDGDDESRKAPRASKRKPRKAPKLTRTAPPAREQHPDASVPKATKIREELKDCLASGPKSKAAILKRMTERGIMGHEDDPMANLSTYLSRAKDLVTNDGQGNWSLVLAEKGAA